MVLDFYFVVHDAAYFRPKITPPAPLLSRCFWPLSVHLRCASCPCCSSSDLMCFGFSDLYEALPIHWKRLDEHARCLFIYYTMCNFRNMLEFYMSVMMVGKHIFINFGDTTEKKVHAVLKRLHNICIVDIKLPPWWAHKSKNVVLATCFLALKNVWLLSSAFLRIAGPPIRKNVRWIAILMISWYPRGWWNEWANGEILVFEISF